VRDRLAGKKVLLTGGSGFLGKAVMAALLRTAPDIGQLAVLLRAPDGESARRRLLEDVLPSDAFGALPETALRARLDDDRILPIAGDLETADVSAAAVGGLADVDVVIHCAATVSFEEALDDALSLNAFGPARLLARVRAAGSEPHFVHVSTAYVADRRSGEVHEEGEPHHGLAEIDPEALLAEGRAWREEAERESKAEPLRSRFKGEAERDAARREGMDAAERAEELRRRWIQVTLSRRGRRRAKELGWPDTYALSKAVGERILTEASARTTIIRPTIIESSLELPNPGWLEGIKVADPLILAYASRGLTHLPGRESNVIDIVPVDLVANACVIAAAHPPEEMLRAIAIASSARNPLSIGGLAEQIRAYFLREPLPGRNGTPIEIGRLSFVDRRVALRRTVRREKLAATAARVAMASPLKLPQERMLRSNRSLAERVTRMVRIYGSYTELDCVFDDSNACRLAASLSPQDRAALPIDTAAIDWDHYLQEVHLPQVRRLATGS
jgi:nucleoside-diphosphate-sugar epimerase